jgi:predicted ester cyclase
MSVAENCAVLRRFLEEAAVNVDSPLFDEVVHEDVLLPEDMGGTGTGRERLKSGLAGHLEAFDMTIQVQDIFGDGNKVVARQVVRGKHVAPFMGAPATGKEFQIEEMVIARFRDDKVAQFWRVVDLLGMQTQLGLSFSGQAIPSPAQA